MNSYIAYVCRRVLNSRYTEFGWNRLRGQRINLEHTHRQTDRQTDKQTHIRFYIYIYIYFILFIYSLINDTFIAI
jgi:hypothetical protein